MTTESDLATAASASDPRVGLRAVRALRRLLEELERTQVRRARRAGLVVGRDRGGARGQPAGRAQEARQGLRGDRDVREIHQAGARAGRAGDGDRDRVAGQPGPSRAPVRGAALGRAAASPYACSSPGRRARAAARGARPAARALRRRARRRGRRGAGQHRHRPRGGRPRGSTTATVAEARRRRPRFSRASKKVLELALREAIALRHNYIGTEHILLGMVRGGRRHRARHVARRRRGHRRTCAQAVAGGRTHAPAERAALLRHEVDQLLDPAEQRRVEVLEPAHAAEDVLPGAGDVGLVAVRPAEALADAVLPLDVARDLRPRLLAEPLGLVPRPRCR